MKVYSIISKWWLKFWVKVQFRESHAMWSLVTEQRRANHGQLRKPWLRICQCNLTRIVKKAVKGERHNQKECSWVLTPTSWTAYLSGVNDLCCIRTRTCVTQIMVPMMPGKIFIKVCRVSDWRETHETYSLRSEMTKRIEWDTQFW